jgi:hypothetical protein
VRGGGPWEQACESLHVDGYLAGVVRGLLIKVSPKNHQRAKDVGCLPSSLEEGPSEVGDDSLVGEPASARPSRLEMEGNEHLDSSIGGEGGGCVKLVYRPPWGTL